MQRPCKQARQKGRKKKRPASPPNDANATKRMVRRIQGQASTEQSTQTSCRRESAQADHSLPFRRTHARAINSQISPGRAVYCGLSGGRGRIWLAQPVLDGRSAVCEQRGDESWTLACKKNCSVPWKGQVTKRTPSRCRPGSTATKHATRRKLWRHRESSGRNPPGVAQLRKSLLSLHTYKIVLYMACACINSPYT